MVIRAAPSKRISSRKLASGRLYTARPIAFRLDERRAPAQRAAAGRRQFTRLAVGKFMQMRAGEDGIELLCNVARPFAKLQAVDDVSRDVMCGHKASLWKIIDILRRSGGTLRLGEKPRDHRQNFPAEGSTKPAISRKVVVLAATDGPSRQTSGHARYSRHVIDHIGRSYACLSPQLDRRHVPSHLVSSPF